MDNPVQDHAEKHAGEKQKVDHEAHRPVGTKGVSVDGLLRDCLS